MQPPPRYFFAFFDFLLVCGFGPVATRDRANFACNDGGVDGVPAASIVMTAVFASAAADRVTRVNAALSISRRAVGSVTSPANSFTASPNKMFCSDGGSENHHGVGGPT